MKYLKDLISRMTKKSQETVVEEPLVTLIQVAQESPDIQKTLLSILQKDEFHRTSMLNTLMEEMRYKGAPEPLIRAMASLRDPHVAQKAYDLLNK